MHLGTTREATLQALQDIASSEFLKESGLVTVAAGQVGHGNQWGMVMQVFRSCSVDLRGV